MSTYHIVKQGEYLCSIAKQYGFSDYRIIWNDSKNSELKNKRQNPSVLHPGDSLFIRDKEQRQEARPTDKRHKFIAKRSPLKLRLVVEDQYKQPIANAACALTIESDFQHLTTDGEGKLEQNIPSDAAKGMLIMQDSQTFIESIQIPINIGHLDPVEEVSGQRGRLSNLGYLAGDPAEESNVNFQSAVEEFQCENQLTVDGICGPSTQAKLKQVHGC